MAVLDFEVDALLVLILKVSSKRPANDKNGASKNSNVIKKKTNKVKKITVIRLSTS